MYQIAIIIIINNVSNCKNNHKSTMYQIAIIIIIINNVSNCKNNHKSTIHQIAKITKN
jgi:hypothetical protein